MAHIVVEREFGGRTLRMETGKYAKQADASVWVTYAETTVLAAAVRGAPREGIDFFPLAIDYRERLSAAGKFPGGFRKREGAPTQKETLTMRLIDRPLRPLFPMGLRDEVLVQCFVESADGQNDPDVVAGTAAAAAVSLSSIPFEGPVATVRVGRIESQFVINPTQAQLEYSDMELVLSGHRDGINMIEVGAREASNETVLEAIKFGHQHIFILLDMIDELVKKAGKEKTAELHLPPAALVEDMQKLIPKIREAKLTEGKLAREAAVKSVLKEYMDAVAPMPNEASNVNYVQYLATIEKRKHIKVAWEQIEEKATRQAILDGRRPDGRAADQLRKLTCEVGVLARTHGSAVFTRGETQALVTCTLGTTRDEQVVDGLHDEYSQKFMLHYNFPPFSTGEAKRVGAPGRREIGHGALAERSLAGILPDAETFPYTIRLVSDIFESNGSSSMASVCGGCLALMDAGVPIKATCAGISVGMVEEGNRRVLITDILGEEDHFGDMDFKVSGTRTGITGIQLDLKTRGLTLDIIAEVFQRAYETRIQIIEAIEAAIPEPRKQLSPYAPRLLRTKIDPEKIGKLIGPGGKTIRAIQESTGATIDVEEDGTVYVSAVGQGKAEAALAEVERLCEEVQAGKVYNGRVTSIKDFGAFIEVIPGQDGLCHISELTDAYVERVTDVLQMGEMVRVKVLSIDDQGRLRLSRKALLIEEGVSEVGKIQPSAAPAEGQGGDGGQYRGGGDRGGRGRGPGGGGRGRGGDRGGRRDDRRD
jgi:polyribonucleotide nucleotidyltransferase